MTQGLEHIYREVSAGRLSQREALERVREFRQLATTRATKRMAILQVAPVWERSRQPAYAQVASYAEHHVLVHGLPHIDHAELRGQLYGEPAIQRLRDDAALGLGGQYRSVATALFETLRGVLVRKPQGLALVQLVVADDASAGIFAGLAGLIETAMLEYPDVLAQIVFVAPSLATDELVRQLTASAVEPRQRVLRYVDGARDVRRWRELADTTAAAPACFFKEHGVYLITGGLGGLGMLVAREILAQTGHARVVLCGRAAPDAVRSRLETLDGDRAAYRQADVSDTASTQALIDGIVDDYGQLDGIVHSAGVLRDEFIMRKSQQQFEEVLRPKIAGTENLDLASRALPLDFFLLFSSIAVWAGNVGQADYAAANGFMDEFAAFRNAQVAAGARHGRTVSIAWPHWLDGGMSIDATSLGQLEQRTGLRSMATADGMRALHHALAARHDHIMVMHGDAAQIRRALDGSVIEPPPVRTPPMVAEVGDLSVRTRAYLREAFANVLKIPLQRIETKAPLENYGIDSILAMRLTSHLEASFGALPKTLFFEYLSIEELAGYFVRSHADTLAGLLAVSSQPAASKLTAIPETPLVPARAEGANAPVARRRRLRRAEAVSRNTASHARVSGGSVSDTGAPGQTMRAAVLEPIAIVGLSGRYPEAWDLEAFWVNLRDGRDCITEIPAQRWDWRDYYSEDRTRDGAHFSKWGGFIEGADEFDPRFFNISPREARTIDPQERLFLQHAWMAIEDAGYTRARLQVADAGGSSGQIGVYAGVMYGEYNLSGSLASIANRVSYFLNLHGPSLTLDTMCSSSLTAIHLACQDLRLGRTSLALAGGVNLSIDPSKYSMLSGGQFISGDGHCQSFGEGGDGYIPGEGVGVAVLKRLSDAQRDGDHIYGVVRGSALNHGGKTNGYTVPNPRAQADVIRRALVEAGVDARQLNYIEAHGTGTKLGDPIEIAALSNAFHQSAPQIEGQTGICLVGSAKSNIGHCESAAGIAGVTKVLLQMKHGQIVPSLHSRRLNPNIDFSSTPFVVVQDLQVWPAPVIDGVARTRMAGISSFGAGGSNAHVIIEEYQTPEVTAPVLATPLLVPLSARTADQLIRRVTDLLVLIERAGQAPDLGSLAWTLQTGREAMDERAVFISDSIDHLLSQLRAFVAGEATGGAVFHDQVRKHRDAVAELADDVAFAGALATWHAERNLTKLGELWSRGVELNWQDLAGGAPPRLMSLPTYPFARESYWRERPVVAGSRSQVLHSLVHANTSDLTRQCYQTFLRGADPLLVTDANGHQILPPLAMLEILRAAVALSVPRTSSVACWEWRDIHWGEPVSVAGERAVCVGLFPRADDVVDVEIYSGEGGTDTVHAQGRVAPYEGAAAARIELERMKTGLHPMGDGAWMGDGQLVVEEPLAGSAHGADRDMILTPAIWASLMKWTAQLVGKDVQPLALDSMRVWAKSGGASVLVLRTIGCGEFDVQICDEGGHVWAQLGSLRMVTVDTEAVVATVDAAAVDTKTAGAAPIVATAVNFAPANRDAVTIDPPDAAVDPMPARSWAVTRDATPRSTSPGAKPIAVRLGAAHVISPRLASVKPVTQLHAPSSTSASHDLNSTSIAVSAHEQAPGIVIIDIHQALRASLDALRQAVLHVNRHSSLKTVLLIGRHAAAWQGDRDCGNAAVRDALYAALMALPCPVIAVTPQGASGSGLLLAAMCDFLQAGAEAIHGFVDVNGAYLPSQAEDRYLRERLGDAVADELLYRSAPCSGRQLNERGWSCRVAPGTQCVDEALAFAAVLAKKPQRALHLLKNHLARDLSPLAAVFSPYQPDRTSAVGGQVIVVRLGDDATQLSQLAQINAVFDRLATQPGNTSVIILVGGLRGFLPELQSQQADPDAFIDLLSRLQAAPVPVIAALEGDVEGLAWLFALACDAVVHNRHARYTVTSAWSGRAARHVAALGAMRLGAPLGYEMALSERAYEGSELPTQTVFLRMAEKAQVVVRAQELASHWTAWPRAALTGWKQAQAQRYAALLAALPSFALHEHASAVVAPATHSAALAHNIALASSVVSVQAYADGVVVVTLADRAAKNMFSPDLIAGLSEAFAHIAAMPSYKAVVLTGFDSYFATGGTVQTLLAIQEGQAQFTDERIFQAAMDCQLPVIAAIQGHAIGGGWSFGMFADVVLLSEESRYLSPYMDYGFTPGAGSTLMLPAKMGYDLARETLLSAQEISGQELKARGIALHVLPRKNVLAAAVALARHLACRPREALIAQKRMWTDVLRQTREAAYRQELLMHEETFVGNTGTLTTIRSRFGDTDAVNAPVAPVALVPRETVASGSEIRESLKIMLAQELFLQADEIEDDTPFIDLGLDSITGVTWVRKINETYGTGIAATEVYSHPTLGEIAGLVMRAMQAAGEPEGMPMAASVTVAAKETASSPVAAKTSAPLATKRRLASWRGQAQAAPRLVSQSVVVPPHAPKPIPQRSDSMRAPIAIIGMAGQFAQAKNIDEFWQNLVQGRDCISEIPATRWDSETYYRSGLAAPGKTNSRWLGALEEYDLFDPLFFSISPTEAENMEPQQRVFLQTCWHGIENAGYSPGSLSGQLCGVFVGCGPSEYHQIAPTQQLSAQGFTGAASSILASRISYFLNLRGPCMAIETACSSSLVAVANACDSLNTGGSDLALAGGVYVMAGPAMHIMTAQAGMLSVDGRCFSFDQRANGFVPGEGAGVVVLKRLADAQRDHDRILGVIEGWGINQDGKTNGMTAPNQAAQSELLQSVYRRFDIDPAQIQLIEAHGTGTKLGDPIEVAGLKAAFGAFTHNNAYSALGSVKSNIGHCLTAAGIAGVIKVVQALRHQTLPPTINYQQCNEHIQLDGSPFYINDQRRAWDVAPGQRRRGAVSAFGFSGTNAHLVLAEASATVATRAPVNVLTEDGKLMIPLSARTEAQLRQKAEDLLAFLRRHPETSLTDIAYTLQVGRDAMGERLGLLAGSVDMLVTQLQAFVSGEPNAAGVYQGQVKRNRDEIKLIAQDEEMQEMVVGKWLGERRLSKLLALWAKGLAFDWSRLYGADKPQRIELPNYPFAKEHYWLVPEIPTASSALVAGHRQVAVRLAANLPVSEVEPQPETVMMTPRWDVMPVPDEAAVAMDLPVLVIGANAQQRDLLESHHGVQHLHFIDIAITDDVVAIADKLQQAAFDRLIWIASAHEVATLAEETLIEDQERGIMQVLRIAKALVGMGDEKRDLVWDMIVANTLPVRQGESLNPTHAGLQGFAGCMTEVYSHWKIRLFDLQAWSQPVVAAMDRLPLRGRNACYALRGSEWFEQRLIPVDQMPEDAPTYRQRGVYVVIGGSGGLGNIWTRHLIRHYDASVVWIGRRPRDASIQRQIDEISRLGRTPEYIQADASQLLQMQAAYQQIKARHPAIHGVVHSAVGTFDQSLKTVSEADFRSILSVKIDASVRIAQVFDGEALDFVLFFSSNASFVRGAGMSGYSAGCTFKDAFALQLGRQWPGKVQVINWGYWSVGAGEAMTDAMKAYFHETGYRPLDPEQGMAILDHVLASTLSQVSITRKLPQTVEPLSYPSDRISDYGATPGVAMQEVADAIRNIDSRTRFRHIAANEGRQMEPLLARLLRGILAATPNILPIYERWLSASRAFMPIEQPETLSLPQLWQAWEDGLREWTRDPGAKELALLVDLAMRALPDILVGRRKATDVLFPNSSLELVERVYKTETVGLAYNHSLSDTLAAAVRARVEADPHAHLRMLEIGAGTGASTVGIIAALQPWQAQVAEYCYTDLSKAFLFHAQQHYAPRAPYLRTQLFNVEQPLAGQDVQPGSYDFVIAANVVHATKNVRNTLRNAKALLRRNGVLLLNEISEKSLRGHVTFGLLDGWWLNEDCEVRIPGSPGLYPQAWQRVLEEEGFHSVQFPCAPVHASGQQIVVAFSDGVARQRRAQKEQPRAMPALAVEQVQAVRYAPAVGSELAVDAPQTDEQLLALTVGFCKQLIGKALKIEPALIDATEPLESYGIDSIIVGLVNQQLQQHFDDVGATLLYENQTVEALARHLLNTQRDVLNGLFGTKPQAPSAAQTPEVQIAPEPVPTPAFGTSTVIPASVEPPVSPTLSAPSHAPHSKGIAIVGISGMYPMADSLDAFWENLKSGRDCITEIPPSRWSLEGFYEPDERIAVAEGKSYCKWGGFIDRFAEFDTLFFGIPPREALNMDPQERLFMQTAWAALENAGYTRQALKQQFQGRVGVFAGITRVGYNLYRMALGEQERFWPRTSFSSVANRLSYFLDIHGPSLPVDTMCSSSLTAIHEACEHIRHGDCEMALAGGVNLYLHPTSYIDMSSQHMLSGDGRCRSFGEGANGFVPGEGVGVVLLKSLDRALADEDIIHGVILATQVNHGGRTNGFTVPNPVAQADLIRRALDKAGVHARDVSYIEAHGTGTDLGDPIEIAGLQQAFGDATGDKGFCRIGSAKSNVGHLEAAAGIAGLTKVLLQFRHGQIVPSLHAAQANPHIRFEKTPFVLNRELMDWEQPVVDGQCKPRIAGISSFGAGGANAHVILQEFVPDRVDQARTKPASPRVTVVPLSARSDEHLCQKARELAAFLDANTRLDLDELAYTLQTGREAMEVRLAIVADSVDVLRRRLRAFANGEHAANGVHCGTVPHRKDRVLVPTPDDLQAIDEGVRRGEYSRALALWVQGVAFDWHKLYDTTRHGRRIELPTYPFARDSYWIDSVAGHGVASPTPAPKPAVEPVPELADSVRVIEDIISRIDDASMDAAEGAQLLRKLV
ncbi:SDR family NAD(P)-dependent oxidoreductase [Bordetella tumulicola]|uniref:SDR family NAD(P)-dependent oxidoreductase n=1 Tax=Bordetella tumulicola TaxID=1649133 RepID=UPI0039EF45A0